MQRTLQINNPETFDLLYFGFIAGGAKLTEKTGKDGTAVDSRVRIRKERDIHKAFRAIATRTTNEIGYGLKPGGGTLELSQEEYEYMDKCLGACDWATIKAVEIADMFDEWGSAEKIEVGPQPVASSRR